MLTGAWQLCKRSKIGLFAKIGNGWRLLVNSILDIWHGSGYAFYVVHQFMKVEILILRYSGPVTVTGAYKLNNVQIK